jgi:hypothetical protein
MELIPSNVGAGSSGALSCRYELVIVEVARSLGWMWKRVERRTEYSQFSCSPTRANSGLLLLFYKRKFSTSMMVACRWSDWAKRSH